MCDFCENGKFKEVDGYETGRNMNIASYFSNGIDGIMLDEDGGEIFLVFDNSGGEYGKGAVKIAFCPMCGRKLSEETGHSDPFRQTIKEVAEEMPALGKYEGDYAFPCGAFGYMDDLYRVDFSCSNCGKRHEGVIFGTEIVCDCGKKIKTGS